MPQSNIKMKTVQYANSVFVPKIIELLDEGHTVTINLRGYSMRPYLENNRDKALIRKIGIPRKGDIVLAETQPKVYVIHRIIKINGDDITLRGDGNMNCEYCKRSDLKGYVIGFYRKGRSTLEKTNSPGWILYSVVWNFLFPIRRYLLFIYRRLCVSE